MTKLSGVNRKKDFLLIVSIKILITQKFMLIPMQKNAFDFNHYILTVTVTVTKELLYLKKLNKRSFFLKYF